MPSLADTLTSLLFVPGSRPERFAKALETGASVICIDLEDAVAPNDKASARAAALAAIGPRVAIRVNGIRTRAGIADLLALGQMPDLPALVLVPMVESADEVAIVAAVLDGALIVPLIETARGLRNAHEIAAMPGVVAMMFGGGDLSAELGVALAWEPLVVARSLFVMACASANISAIDVPYLALDDVDGLAEECRRAREIGFQAKAAIHPAQVDVITTAFVPSPSDVAEARAALHVFSGAGGGAIRFNGRMLEAPLIARYRKIIARAGEQGEGADA
jgi:citrate lyase beta subunit